MLTNFIINILGSDIRNTLKISLEMYKMAVATPFKALNK